MGESSSPLITHPFAPAQSLHNTQTFRPITVGTHQFYIGTSAQWESWFDPNPYISHWIETNPEILEKLSQT